MKLKEIFYGLGLKPPPREYPFDLDTFVLPREGEVQFARWRHPRERRKVISQSTVDALRQFLRDGDTAIDIGAHAGDTTVPMALAVGSQGSVLAFEPNPYAFKILLANAALNRKKTNIFPLMLAATPEDGQFEFEYSDSGFCNGGMHEGIQRWKHCHFFKLSVQGRNLDRYLRAEFPDRLPNLRFIKIDTEGFDWSVVKSLKPLLLERRPFLRSEIYKHLPPDQRVGYYQDLHQMGYRVFRFNSDEDYQGPELAAGEMMNWEHFDLFAVPAELS